MCKMHASCNWKRLEVSNSSEWFELNKSIGHTSRNIDFLLLSVNKKEGSASESKGKYHYKLQYFWMRLKSIVWKCLQRQRFFCRRMTSFTMFTYSLRDTARFWLSRRGCRFESASKLDTLPLLTLKSKSKTFIEPDRLRIHYRAHVPIKQVGLRMAVIKAKDDSIGFHSTDSRQPNQMVHSFPDRRGHGRFEKSFNLDHTPCQSP